MSRGLWQLLAAGVSAATVFGLCAAGAVSGTGANGKLAYTEAVSDQGSLVVSFDESGQKRFASVEYELVATAVVEGMCEGGQEIGSLIPDLSNTTSITPDAQGHAIGGRVRQAGVRS